MNTTPMMPAPADDPRWGRLRRAFPKTKIELRPVLVDERDTVTGTCTDSDDTGVSLDGLHCGGVHSRAVHVEYVGVEAVKERLNTVDHTWTYRPLGLDAPGSASSNPNRGIWVEMTVLGVTRVGYGAPDDPGDTIAKQIQTATARAIRAAAAEFGVGAGLRAAQAPTYAYLEEFRRGAAPTAPAVPVPQLSRADARERIAGDKQAQAQGIADQLKGVTTQAELNALFREAADKDLGEVLIGDKPLRTLFLDASVLVVKAEQQ